MDRISINNIDRYIRLQNQLSLEDRYIIAAIRDEFLKLNSRKIELRELCIYILNLEGDDIGFIEFTKGHEILFIENIYLNKSYRSMENYKIMLSLTYGFASGAGLNRIKFTGINDNRHLADALSESRYAMDKEHIQMEKNIEHEDDKNDIEYKTFIQINDTDFIYDFMKECMKGSIFNYSSDEIREITENEEYKNYIFYDCGQAIGFGISSINEKRNRQENENSFYIEQIAVRNGFRNKGYGRRIIKFLTAKAGQSGMETARLHVYSDNRNAYELYKSCGFYDVKSIGCWIREI